MKYFKHQANMRHDTRIRLLVNRYGLEGYGLYNLILESIVEGLDDAHPIPELRETCEDLASMYNGNTAKINEMASWMINAGLFDVSEISERINCIKILKYLEVESTRSQRLQDMIRDYKAQSRLLLSVTNPDVSPTVPDNPRQSQTKVSFPLASPIHQRSLQSESILLSSKQEEDSNPPIVPPSSKTEPVLATRVMNYLNERTNSKFRTHKGTGLTQLVTMGTKWEDFKAVIDNRTEAWLDDVKMGQYLTPSTLFRPANFDKYLQMAEKGITGNNGETKPLTDAELLAKINRKLGAQA